jgi:hypothetical protein
VFGEDNWYLGEKMNDTQIDIFREPAARIKKHLGTSSASWWWLRSANGNFNFCYVSRDGNSNNYYADGGGGVVVGFCIETRSYHPEGIVV